MPILAVVYINFVTGNGCLLTLRTASCVAVAVQGSSSVDQETEAPASGNTGARLMGDQVGPEQP
jgi:hypothetical protein